MKEQKLDEQTKAKTPTDSYDEGDVFFAISTPSEDL